MNLAAAWFWPAVSNRRFAQNAIQEAFWAAVFVSVLTASLTTILLFSPDGTDFASIGFVNSALFGALAFGIYRKSRIAAVSAFVLFTAGTIFQFATIGPSGLLLRGLIALAFFPRSARNICLSQAPTVASKLTKHRTEFSQCPA